MKPELYDYVNNKIQEIAKTHGKHLRRAVYDIMVHNYSLDKVGAYSEYRVKPAGYWTLETCKASALDYSSKGKWEKGNGSAYQIARRNNWLDECCVHMEEIQKYNGYWTLEKCKESALNYSSKKEWRKGEGGAHLRAYKNNWLDECCKHMKELKKTHRYWTLEKCKESALNYSSKKEWRKGEGGAHSKAYKNNWLDECCKHMKMENKHRGFWTLETCKESALNYSSKKEWAKNESSAYSTAHKKNWIDKCCAHMEEGRKPNGYWTLETCKESALNYSNKSKWKKGESSAYNKAKANNWLEECCQNMNTLQNK